MAQHLVSIKSLGEKKVYNFGIDTPEHIWLYKDLLSHQSFNLPHSYAYSLLGVVGATLKCYYPVEFWTAALNTIDKGQEKHNENSLGKYINSITQAGIKFERPNINKSGLIFESVDDSIYFALTYVKDVSKGANTITELKPYTSWDDFLEKAIKNKINKRVVKALIFCGAVDFGDDIEARAYKWPLFLNARGKKDAKEAKTYTENMPDIYELIKIEYDYCHYSFTGIDAFLNSNPKLKNVQTISERDKSKKLWVLIGYINSIVTKKSKKSGNDYVLITLTDFRDTLSVYVFYKEWKARILSDFAEGQLVKIVVKNEDNWPKLPGSHELNGKSPIQAI